MASSKVAEPSRLCGTLPNGRILAGGFWPSYLPDHFVEWFNPDGTVFEDLRFERIVRLPNGEVHLSLRGQLANRYLLEATTDFDLWTPLLQNDRPFVPLGLIDTNAPGLPQRFYRIRCGAKRQ